MSNIRVSVSELAQHTKRIMEYINERDRPVIVTRYRKAIAVILPYRYLLPERR